MYYIHDYSSSFQNRTCPSPICDLQMGAPCGYASRWLGRGSRHKRTTPKLFARAKQLHRTMTPAEAQLWKHLRAHRMGDVHFRNQHAIGHYIVDFCASRKKLINVNVTLNEVKGLQWF